MANGWGFGKTPSITSAYQSPNRRLSQMLMQGQMGQPRQQRRGNTGQIVDFLQSGLGAYLMQKDMGQQQAAQQAFATGAKGGDLKGAMTALEGLSGNPYAQNRLQNLLMRQIGQSQKEKQRLKELGSERETYKFQQEHKAFPPTKLVPGKDVPYSPEVQRQSVERVQAGKPSWGQMPGVQGMMVSSLGQMQAIPQTSQQKAQATLEAETAKAQAEARREFPKVEQKAQEALTNIEALTTHPGFEGVIGVPDTLSGLVYKIFGTAPPGTDEAGFTARLDQIGGQQFLQAFESLKGGGAISEIEGTKASNAMSRLAKTGQSEESYLQAANELKMIINKGLASSRAAAGLPLQPSVAPMGQPLSIAGQPISMPQGSPMVPAVNVQSRDPLQDIRSGETSFPLESTATGYQPPSDLQPSTSGIAQITSETEYNALPPGAVYSVSGGKAKRKR